MTRMTSEMTIPSINFRVTTNGRTFDPLRSFFTNRQHEDHSVNILHRVRPHHSAAVVFIGCHAHGRTHGWWRRKRRLRDSGRRHHRQAALRAP
ncbi:hypothetical protein AVEN_59027-1 [Araneus ventricosus]|uniref:Uncharacterized protein n=1 Tax=Araneus ventricosus TaxID=182803 RepID=A0A4Y2TFR1_ARAVE|nr:hypothetical protein AVEN_65551-1 [Araneus ventricosus]GBN99457.1 hypothetical protein AVEN_59027-1 [Araneus ventricosus]